MVFVQHGPTFLRPPLTLTNARRAPERIAPARSDWSDVVVDVVGRQSATDAAAPLLAHLTGSSCPPISQPELPCLALLQLGELGEDQLQGVPHAFVRFALCDRVPIFTEPAAHRYPARAARLLLQRSRERWAEHREFSSLIVCPSCSTADRWDGESVRFRSSSTMTCRPIHRTRSAYASRGHCGQDATLDREHSATRPSQIVASIRSNLDGAWPPAARECRR